MGNINTRHNTDATGRFQKIKPETTVRSQATPRKNLKENIGKNLAPIKKQEITGKSGYSEVTNHKDNYFWKENVRELGLNFCVKSYNLYLETIEQ